MPILSRCSWILFFLLAPLAFSAEQVPQAVQGVGIFPKLGATLDLSTPFQDEAGQTITLKNYFDGRQPVALILNYYGCPMLCGVMLNQAKDAFRAIDWKMGDRYQVITISIDPTEKSDLAAKKKAAILKSTNSPEFEAAAQLRDEITQLRERLITS